MTANASVEVSCDGPTPGDECPDSAAWADYGTAADLRARMRGDGWQTGLPGGIDRCPQCRSTTPTPSRRKVNPDA